MIPRSEKGCRDVELSRGCDNSWQMLSHSCIWMNIEKMHTTKNDCGTIYFEAQMCTSLHEYGW